MAAVSMSRAFCWMVFCTCLAVCVSSPTRRQFVTITETTSSDPAAVTNDASVWDDSDDFDLDGDQWMNRGKPSPSSIPERREYEEYDDDDYPADQDGKVLVDFGDDEVEHQEAEEDDTQNKNDSEFLFVPSKDTRLLLEDDDDDSGPIKVRHTGRNSYSRVIDVGNSVDASEEDKEPFEFTIDEEVDDDDDDDKEDDIDDDVIVEDTPSKHVSNIHDLSHDDEDDDEEFAAEGDDEPIFENPEEEAAQVIYGDHVFLY